jgi:peptidoglycan/xylan/chitin deacetylase (PgdA/CDA1 family)
MLDCFTFSRRITKRISKFLLCPIEVFVFHAVCDRYDEKLNQRADWTSTDEFKTNILALKDKYHFISLDEAFQKLRRDLIRTINYAVLTCDDGFASVMDILPFLEKQQIPVTLFVNPKYLDGVSKREGYTDNPRYILKEDLWNLKSPLITIGMHGYEHNDATRMTKEEFFDSVERCKKILESHPRYIPYYAYTWGNYSPMTQQVLIEKEVIPVFTDGESNYRYRQGIGRKPIDSYYLKKKVIN